MGYLEILSIIYNIIYNYIGILPKRQENMQVCLTKQHNNPITQDRRFFTDEKGVGWSYAACYACSSYNTQPIWHQKSYQTETSN